MDQELRNALIAVLKALQEKPDTKRSRIATILNAPFTVTLMGGILLACVSGIITQISANSAKERDLALERLRQKQAFIETFNTNLYRYMELTLSLQNRRIFLQQWKEAPDLQSIRYSDGRNLAETRIKWEEEKRYWLEHSPGHPAGLINTAKIIFPKKAIKDKLNLVKQAAERYSLAQTSTDLVCAYNQLGEAIDIAAETMAKTTAQEMYEK